MYILEKTVRIRCGHKLSVLPVGHKCLNPHGEFYTITVVLQFTDDQVIHPTYLGVDFGDVKSVLEKEVVSVFDHAFLVWKGDPNIDVFEELARRGYKIVKLDAQPTAEYLAYHIYHRLLDTPLRPYLKAVRIVESADNVVEYRKEH